MNSSSARAVRNIRIALLALLVIGLLLAIVTKDQLTALAVGIGGISAAFFSVLPLPESAIGEDARRGRREATAEERKRFKRLIYAGGVELCLATGAGIVSIFAGLFAMLR